MMPLISLRIARCRIKHAFPNQRLLWQAGRRRVLPMLTQLRWNVWSLSAGVILRWRATVLGEWLEPSIGAGDCCHRAKEGQWRCSAHKKTMTSRPGSRHHHRFFLSSPLQTANCSQSGNGLSAAWCKSSLVSFLTFPPDRQGESQSCTSSVERLNFDDRSFEKIRSAQVEIFKRAAERVDSRLPTRSRRQLNN